MYEKRIMKPILKGREEGVRKSSGGVNLIKVHYMHTWKYHNETPSYN
jgi:hypothetical protein